MYKIWNICNKYVIRQFQLRVLYFERKSSSCLWIVDRLSQIAVQKVMAKITCTNEGTWTPTIEAEAGYFNHSKHGGNQVPSLLKLSLSTLPKHRLCVFRVILSKKELLIFLYSWSCLWRCRALSITQELIFNYLLHGTSLFKGIRFLKSSIQNRLKLV